jgi:hypothetical protein
VLGTGLRERSKRDSSTSRPVLASPFGRLRINERGKKTGRSGRNDSARAWEIRVKDRTLKFEGCGTRLELDESSQEKQTRLAVGGGVEGDVDDGLEIYRCALA